MSVLCISIFRFLLFVLACGVYFLKTQKIPKIFSLFLYAFILVIRVVVLFCLFYFRVDIQKTQKYFPFYLLLPCFVLKFENTKNICCSSWFCIVLFRFNSRLWLHLELGFHFISFKSCERRAIMTIFDNLMWWEAGMNRICFHFCTHTCPYDCA
jgi:hypothetical protein